MTVFLSTDRLNLLLALLCALTGTWWGLGTAVLILAVTAARRWVRHHLEAGPPAAPGRAAGRQPGPRGPVPDGRGSVVGGV